MNNVGDVVRGDGIGRRSKEWFVWTECPQCNLQRWVRRSKKELQTYTGWCQTCSAKRNNKMRTYSTSENSLAWKGGRTKDHGYILVRLQPDNFYYPMTNHDGYVREHRLVVAQSLKRCLEVWEVVHHINGIKDDNVLENLELLQSAKYHQTDMQLKARMKQSFSEGKQAGIQEVVDWLDKNCACFAPDPEKNGEYIIPEWQVKLKDWGIR